MTIIRVGLGFDTHAFQEGNQLIIGGVKIPFHKSFKAHSDGDVLIHAICDALLGASGNKDIGTFFPDTDSKYKNINSLMLLEKVMNVLKIENWKVNNIDCTIIIQEPKMSPHIDLMKEMISPILEIDNKDISIKAKTSEHIGFIGRGEGVSAQAAVLLIQQ